VKIRHYLKPPTEFGGANGYIMNFVADMPDSDVIEYVNTKPCAGEDILVFHRADGIKIKISIVLERLFKKKNTKIVQTFHNPVLPYREAEYNGNKVGKMEKFREVLRFSLSLLTADLLYFASPRSIDAYRSSLLFRLLAKSKDIVYYPTRLATEKVEKLNNKASEGKVIYGFLGRRANVKGSEIFEALAKKYIDDSQKKFVATWPVDLELLGIECLGVRNKWEFLSEIDYLIIPNKNCYYDLVFLEALSFGVPVVTSDIGGAKDIVDDYFKLFPLEELNRIDLDSLCIKKRDTIADVSAPAVEIRRDFSKVIESALLK
jgi:glycosyltransferase involved in cell wall biosynthesis